MPLSQKGLKHAILEALRQMEKNTEDGVRPDKIKNEFANDLALAIHAYVSAAVVTIPQNQPAVGVPVAPGQPITTVTTSPQIGKLS